MPVNIIIDNLTPCLIDVASGTVHQTTFSVAKANELRNLQSHGWFFDWLDDDLAYCNIRG